MFETTEAEPAETPQPLLSSFDAYDPKEESTQHDPILATVHPRTVPSPGPSPDISSPRSIDNDDESDHLQTDMLSGDAILIGSLGGWADFDLSRVAGNEGLPDDVNLGSTAPHRQEPVSSDLKNKPQLQNLASDAREAARLVTLPLKSDTSVVSSHLSVHDTFPITDVSTQHYQTPS
ncbi:hypothetical protein FSARC_2956 [Fusarium sarcochroum]|uniref:Uncharacterized protein n=1 Tax=Fusarium sarcochroum TaxID=1208366 RepID=A0A8H4U5G2_9HYPO|nr:hypothetical protein FSARC_2956 [Fusarium sarcochroum]